ncbi:MAG: hypothetical protein VKL41_06475 [Snowella sp.]|nr:hypothetical protein [Snowella sp.]
MPDFQTFIAILTALLVFLTGVFLNYDTIAFKNYQLIIPQWTGLLLAGITFTVVAVDQLLRGAIRFEEVQRRDEEIRRRDEEIRRREEDSVRATNERLEATERETRRTRIETRYRVAVIRFQLNPNSLYRRQLTDILALLEEYRDTL